MKVLLLSLWLSLGWGVFGNSEIALAECSGSIFGDYEQYDFNAFSQVQAFCNGHADNFGIIRVEPQKVEHFGEVSLDDAVPFEDYCYYVQRRTPSGYYRFDARFYYQLASFNGRGQYDIFNQYEEYLWYRVYQGWPVQVRLHFPDTCS